MRKSGLESAAFSVLYIRLCLALQLRFGTLPGYPEILSLVLIRGISDQDHIRDRISQRNRYRGECVPLRRHGHDVRLAYRHVIESEVPERGRARRPYVPIRIRKHHDRVRETGSFRCLDASRYRNRSSRRGLCLERPDVRAIAPRRVRRRSQIDGAG